jgi:DinB superfamily
VLPKGHQSFITGAHLAVRTVARKETILSKDLAVELAVCSRIFRELETQRTHLLAELAGWGNSRLSFRPAPSAWSAVEVLDHIVRAETGTIANVRTGLQNPHALGSEERPGIAALDHALRSDQYFKVPATAGGIHPDAQTTLSNVESRWEQARAELKSLLEAFAPSDVRCGVFCHPFAGWMTFAEVLDHFSAHFYHHGFQLARLREGSAGLPSA